MIKGLILLFFLCIHFDTFSQVKYEKSNANRLRVIQYNISDSERLTIRFDKEGQVSSITKYIFDKADGYQYYFTKNRLDSILRFDTGIKNNELYLINNIGCLNKAILPNGMDLDSFYYLNNRKSKTGKAVKLSAQGLNKNYELDSNGILRRIYDCDSNNNIISGYSIYLSSNGYYINNIMNQKDETIIFNKGYLEGIYCYVDNQLIGFRILFKKKHNGQYVLKELTTMKINEVTDENLKFNNNGTIKN